ncbi:MAG: hypothetical protein IKB15_03845 [Alistipes sp.]|nr:hypothetical protein [Alistipes sp.]
MKKIFLFAALAFGLASCQNDTNIFGVEVTPNEKPVEYTINVDVPELDETRALADKGYSNSGEGAIINGVVASDDYTLRYILEIYDQNDNRSQEILYAHTDAKNATFKPHLIPGRKYTFVVWVDIVPASSVPATGKAADVHYNTSDLRNVTIIEDTWLPMDETRDAFTGKFTVDNLETIGTITVNCTRPFGKLRVITKDMVAVSNLGVTPEYAKVEYTNVPKYSFNAFNGTYTKADGTFAKTHAMFNIADYASNDDDPSEMALYTDYFFAPEEQVALNTFTMTVYDTDEEESKITATTFTSEIPVKRNTLTTVKGNFLTLQDVNLQVVVENNDSFTGSEIEETI